MYKGDNKIAHVLLTSLWVDKHDKVGKTLMTGFSQCPVQRELTKEWDSCITFKCVGCTGLRLQVITPDVMLVKKISQRDQEFSGPVTKLGKILPSIMAMSNHMDFIDIANIMTFLLSLSTIAQFFNLFIRSMLVSLLLAPHSLLRQACHLSDSTCSLQQHQMRYSISQNTV